MVAFTTIYLLFVYAESCNPEKPGECDFVSRPIMEFQTPAECEKEAFTRNKENLSYMHGEFWKCLQHVDEDNGDVK